MCSETSVVAKREKGLVRIDIIREPNVIYIRYFETEYIVNNDLWVREEDSSTYRTTIFLSLSNH